MDNPVDMAPAEAVHIEVGIEDWSTLVDMKVAVVGHNFVGIAALVV